MKRITLKPESHQGMKKALVEKIETLLPDELRDTTSHFKEVYKSLIERSSDKVWFAKECDERLPFLIGGRTQSGKSSFKAIFALFCSELNIPLVIITKGVAESKELHSKLHDCLTEYDNGRYIADCLSVPARGKSRDHMSATFKNGGCVVVADTAAQINKVCDSIEEYRGQDPERRFSVIVDECDEMYRTVGRTQKVEQAYDRLMSMNPVIEVLISATLVPILIDFYKQDLVAGLIQFIEPHDNYVGQECMNVLKDEDGEDVHLLQNELSYKSSVPFYNEKVELLYKDATSCDAEGVLLLDTTNPRVKAEGNVFIKARRVQMKFPEIIVVVIVGNGIHYKTNNNSDWVETEKGTRISEVLEDLDENYGLKTPVFVFGFSKMQRGMSFRSLRRVPTHILLAHGRGYSVEGMLQALGRATFNGKHVLHKNGFHQITVLTHAGDWDSALAYQSFLSEIYQRSKDIAGKSNRLEIKHLLEGRFQGHENFLGIRKIGKRKDFKPTFEENVEFDTIDIEDDRNKRLCSGRRYLDNHYQEDELASRLMDILKLRKPAMISETMEWDHKEIKQHYEDMHDETITLVDLRKKLCELERQSILRKQERVEGTMWSLKP